MNLSEMDQANATPKKLYGLSKFNSASVKGNRFDLLQIIISKTDAQRGEFCEAQVREFMMLVNVYAEEAGTQLTATCLILVIVAHHCGRRPSCAIKQKMLPLTRC